MQCGDAFPDFVWYGDIGYYIHPSAYNYGGGLAYCRSLKAENPTMHDETYWDQFLVLRSPQLLIIRLLINSWLKFSSSEKPISRTTPKNGLLIISVQNF